VDLINLQSVEQAKIIKAIARLRQKFICMPGNEEEVIEVKQGLYITPKFPNCIGALDCTMAAKKF
jgi:hypothetical protein